MADRVKSVRERVAQYVDDWFSPAWTGLFENGVVDKAEEAQARIVMDAIRKAVRQVGGDPPNYDPTFGDGKLCACGDPYHRHFDSYDGMSAVGCKYCECDRYRDPVTGAQAPDGPARKPFVAADDDDADDPIDLLTDPRRRRGLMSIPDLAHLGRREQAAVLWLATCDGLKMARCLSPETLRAVYADLVRAGQYPPEETPDEQRGQAAGEGVHGPAG